MRLSVLRFVFVLYCKRRMETRLAALCRHVDSISDRPWRQSPGGGVLAPVNVRPVDSMALTAHMDGRG